jgi:hypothetical protein
MEYNDRITYPFVRRSLWSYSNSTPTEVLGSYFLSLLQSLTVFQDFWDNVCPEMLRFLAWRDILELHLVFLTLRLSEYYGQISQSRS